MLSYLLSLLAVISVPDEGHACAHPEVVAGPRVSRRIGGWRELAEALDPSAHPATEDAAIGVACGWRPDCDRDTLALCAREPPMACFVRASRRDPWHAFVPADMSLRSPEIQAVVSTDHRHVIVSVTDEWNQRVGDAPCFFDGEDDPDCGYSIDSYGTEYADHVFETATMTIVWDALYGWFDPTGRRPGECARPHEITIAGDPAVFTRRRCDGAVEHFTLQDLAHCSETARQEERNHGAP